MTDAYTTAATLSGTQMSEIAERTIYSANQQRVWRFLVEPYRYLVPSGTAAIVVPTQDTVAFTLLTQGVIQDAVDYNTTGRTLTPVAFGHNILESYQAGDGTPINTVDMYTEATGYAWAVLEDQDSTYGFAETFIEAETSPDHVIGANSVMLSLATGREAIALLRTAGAMQPYHWVVDPIQVNELMTDAEFTAAINRNSAAGVANAAQFGAPMDRFVGMPYPGVYVWYQKCVESTGLWSIMFGKGAVGQAYKLISTDGAPTPSELNVEKTWVTNQFGYRYSFRVMMDVDGVFASGTTDNTHMVAIAS